MTAIRSLRRAREVAPTARAWQREVQCLGDERGLSIEVHRSPPGTSKRNKIEPRLVHQPASLIRQNWPAKPLIGHGARVDPIAATQPAAGRKGTAKAPKTNIPKAALIPDAGRAGIDLQRADLTWRMDGPIAPSTAITKWPCPDRALGLKPGSRAPAVER